MIKLTGIPKMLVSMALEPLPAQVAALLGAGEDLSGHVWAFFDARVPPGRNAAVMQLRSQGATEEQAIRRVDAAIKDSRSKGSIFALGMMMPTGAFKDMLGQLGGDATSLVPIHSWCDAEVPPGAIRVAIVAGGTTQLQHVTV